MKKRKITIKREKIIMGAAAPYYVFVDGRRCGIIEDGEQIQIQMDLNEHSIKICADFGADKYWSEDYIIDSGDSNICFHAYLSTDCRDLFKRIVSLLAI